MSIYQNRDKIIALIDRGAWKHSWHLPKDEIGQVLWHDSKTMERVIGEIDSARKEAIALLVLAEEVSRIASEADE